jgi:hypothetical protein
LFFFITLLPLYQLATFAQTTISGDISGQIFKSSGNPYFVEDNLFVGNNKKTVIKEGCVFLFKPFTVIVVYGTLGVEGLQGNPVVFTSRMTVCLMKFQISHRTFRLERHKLIEKVHATVKNV